MFVEIIFMDASVPKQIECDNVYTKGGMLCVRQGEYITNIPLCTFFLFVISMDATLEAKNIK